MRKVTYYLWGAVFLWGIALVSEAGAEVNKRLVVKKKSSAGVFNRSAFSANDKKVYSYSNQEDLNKAVAKFEADDDVEWVSVDTMMEHFFEPGDAGTDEDLLYSQQWHYHDRDFGINLPLAWDHTLGEEVVVAIIDTGITDHSDLNSKVLPGADLITDSVIGNDGNGRDDNASDPGDWIGPGDRCYTGSSRSSSWHGTHVAGTVAASTGNGSGVAGVSWNAKIVPVRVLGKCGGWSSDIADGIKWAAGLPVPGVSINQNPARVINLSLGGRGSCSAMMQEAIDEANNAGAVIVVAAGNSNQNIDFTKYSPANCEGVVTVAAVDERGDRSFFSNYGQRIDVAAPGGGGMGILSTHNSGQTSPSLEDYTSMKGTSMASPHVAGVAALMVGVNPDLSPAQLRSILSESAKPFHSGSDSESGECGAGVLDAEGAVLSAISTPGDPDFVYKEKVSSTNPNNSAPTWLNYQEDEEGAGACGSVTMDNNGGGPFNFSLVLGLLFALAISHIRVNKSR